MATFVLIPGAGGQAWYWHRLVPELAGHEVIAVDLPAGDDSAGLAEYADAVVEAIGDRRDLVLVGQSLGGFTAPLVAERVPTRLLVLLNAMTPKPGELCGEWGAATGHRQVLENFDPMTHFFHDVPQAVIDEAMAAGEPQQSNRPFEDTWPLAAWPDVPTKFLQGEDDRFFPREFQRRVVRARLGIEIDLMPGGHLVALSRPRELAARLLAYLEDD